MDITNARLTQQLHKAEEDFRMLVIQNKELTRITLMNNFSENAGDIIEKVKKEEFILKQDYPTLTRMEI